jgi:hypothetical protein
VSGQRYFLESEPALAATLDGFLARLAADLDAQPFSGGVAALVLGGGYGRGEGGVFRATEPGRAQLYNDLEFFVFVRDRAAAAPLGQWCHHWERAGTAELGIDVEFKVLPAAVVATAEPTMFYFDLRQGHRLVWGDGELLVHAPVAWRDPARLPLSEPVRLLFNRGSGLLFARWRLEEQPEDPDGFVERNHAKVRLALADAVLAAAGRHDGSCLERARRLAADDFPQPPRFASLRTWHARGVEFKLRPRHVRPGTVALAEENRALTAAWLDTFLWLESRRLGADFPGAAAYLGRNGRLFPGSSCVSNFLRHARDRARRGTALPGWLDYPRGALQRALVAAHSPELGEAEAAGCIGERRASWRAGYRRWWGCYN